jgi:signal transduction histidine kinase
MNVTSRALLVATTASALWYSASAQAATADQAKAMAEKAAAHIKQVGEQKALADFTARRDGFAEGELYVFCYDHNGVNRAHGANAALVGKNLLHLKDPDGKEPNAMIVKTGFEKGEGWVSFKWPDPVTKKIEEKSAYVIHTDDVVCGVGYYKH